MYTPLRLFRSARLRALSRSAIRIHLSEDTGASCTRRMSDHNPPRIASRNLFDVAIGHDNIFHGDKYKISARLTVVNLTNKEALYNFLSTFSGTHYVTPRTIRRDDRLPLLRPDSLTVAARRSARF